MSKRRPRGEPDDEDLRVARRGSTLLLRLFDREAQVLEWVLADLGRLLDGGSDGDAVTRRMFPRAYLDPTEETAESHWQEVVHDDLVEQRRAALQTVNESLATAVVATKVSVREVVLDEEQAEVWLRVLNDARLAFGTALGVTADTDVDGIEPDDPRAEGFAVYDWLTHLLGAFLGALSGTDDASEDPFADA